MKNSIKAGKVSANVFMRRPPHPETRAERDPDGISVTLRDSREEQETCTAVRSAFTTIFGICRVSTSDVRAIPALDAVQDELDHANIIGTPPLPWDVHTAEGEEAIAKARDVGALLADKAIVVWHELKAT